jgi:hypothetical protein
LKGKLSARLGCLSTTIKNEGAETMGVTLEGFWTDLQTAVVAQLKPLQMAEFLHDYRGLWPKIEADIANNAEHHELLARALAIRDALQP